MKSKHSTYLRGRVPADKQEYVDRIWGADLTSVATVLKKQHFFWTKRYIQRLIDEYRRYMSLVVLTGKEIPMSSSGVDAVWHVHICHTRFYREFCQKVFGSFLDHTPSAESPKEGVAASGVFEDQYKRYFGEIDSVWRQPWWRQILSGTTRRRLCTPTGEMVKC